MDELTCSEVGMAVWSSMARSARGRLKLAITVSTLMLSMLAAPAARAGWEVGVGANVGLRPESGGAGGFGNLSLGYRIPVGIDVIGRIGVGAFSGPADLFIPIEVEVRHPFTAVAHDRLRLFVSGSFLHAHEVAWSSFKEQPFSSIVGVCDCIDHRTGLMASGGLLFKPVQAWPIDAGARLSFAALLPDGNQPHFYLTTSFSLAWVF